MSASEEPALELTPRRERIAIGAIALLLVVHLSYYFPRVVDDVFISVRYAENLSHGNGAVYNVGEKVEGYSSPSWMLLQTIAFVLHLEPVTFGKLAGIALLFATVWGVRQIAREMYGVEGWSSFFAPLFVVVNSYLVAWSVLGLETPLHVATIVLAPLLIHRALAKPTRRSNVLAATAIVLLGATRPESPLYVLICCLAPLAFARRRWREAARFVVPAGVVLALLLLLRHAYYGAWVPNTYNVKGAHASFGLSKLADLVSHGTRPSEMATLLGGAIALGFFSWRRKVLTPALFVLADLYFTASVQLDWMPSERHLLPVVVLAPIGMSCVFAEIERRKSQMIQAALTVVCVSAWWDVARVDSRYSPIEARTLWISKKELGKWSDSLKALRRIEPDHIARMNDYNMGQITQCWPVLDTSKEPIHEQWYAGRDIGALGYLTEVNVWDTAGLVTAEVSHDEAYGDRQFVTEKLAEAMFAKRPVAADLYDGWDLGVARRPRTWLRYKVVAGDTDHPNAIVATDREAPAKEERLRRYRLLVEKMPHLFHLHTLYGEAVGAAVEKRMRAIENEEAVKSVPKPE